MILNIWIQYNLKFQTRSTILEDLKFDYPIVEARYRTSTSFDHKQNKHFLLCFPNLPKRFNKVQKNLAPSLNPQGSN